MPSLRVSWSYGRDKSVRGVKFLGFTEPNPIFRLHGKFRILYPLKIKITEAIYQTQSQFLFNTEPIYKTTAWEEPKAPPSQFTNKILQEPIGKWTEQNNNRQKNYGS